MVQTESEASSSRQPSAEKIEEKHATGNCSVKLGLSSEASSKVEDGEDHHHHHHHHHRHHVGAGAGERPYADTHEHIISTGQDVSRYLVDVRDDGETALTFRSFVIGTIFAGLGATLSQIYNFKPVQTAVSVTFLQLLVYSTGLFWAAFLPRASWVEGNRLASLAPLLSFINPGRFMLKEHAVASIIAATAATTSGAIYNFAVQRLFYSTNVDAATAVLAAFSAGSFGYGLVGLFRPFTVYPSEMVYWHNLHTISIFQALHFNTADNRKKLRLFWTAFVGMFSYEFFPAYIFPTLNGVSVFCLASQRASRPVRDLFTNLFGGANANEGLGLLNISFDWQYIGSNPMYLPLVQQLNSWVGFAFCYIAIIAIYYSNLWNSKAFPMLSSSIFSSNGSVYNQSAVFGPSFTLNRTALNEVGLPALTGSNAWHGLTANLSIGGLLAHCILFWGSEVVDTFKSKGATRQDRHYRAMQKYKEAPWWWFVILLGVSFVSGLAVVIRGQTTVAWWSYIIALILGSVVAPFSILLTARLGHGVNTSQLMKMVAGVLQPGKPVANLYFSMWSHEVIMTSLHLSSDLKMGQYLKIPPRVMFAAQLWGTCLGAAINYIVMVSVVDSQRDVLLRPNGSNVWSGQSVQMLNSAAVAWSLAKDLYGFKGPYWIVPMSLLLGMIPTCVQWLLWKRWRNIGPVPLDKVVLPIIYMYSAWMSVGVTSTITSSIIIGLVSQLWIRKSYPRWYNKYNYILGGALNGGAQVMVFVLSFAVFGAAGREHPFPHWAGNPATGHVDHCNGNGALSRQIKHYRNPHK
ncbi:oligopeptide transporter [Pleurotus eryngii]|uniref:Oligopeptide transporter n=1 Tax=Pleurotus eryngii TaxID=5323 RepID=A0A9P5ZSC1_PLEER|nr:oligopeptide transporter [Pleurotus eryngii]